MSDVATPIKIMLPELLAPAGDWDAMRAAVANGADAVYFGLSNFNARHRATNFTLEELPKVISFLHGHNVRGYVTFNTLVFSDELPEAMRFVQAVAAAGADALIVQDLGLTRLISRMCPNLPIHGSTQMTLTEPLGIEFVRKLGVQRVILARELSADEIRRIAHKTDVPVEIFIHGALCVSYSGQCLTSESLGRRSANRGQCAQACRLPYELIVDGSVRDLGDKAYLLSPQDLAAYDLIDELADAGVASFKIEGRLKSAQYVAATTQTYRAAIDALAEQKPFQIPQTQSLDLAQSFSRGFSHGFLDGVDHQELVHARFPKSRGLRIGRIVGRTPRGAVLIETDRPSGIHSPNGIVTGGELKIGDGIVFDEGRPGEDEAGGRIAMVTRRKPNTFEITLENNGVTRFVGENAIVWKTDDPASRKRLEETYSRDRIVRRVSVHAWVEANIGSLLQVRLRDEDGHEVSVQWDQPLQTAQKFPLTEQLFREQFGRMGDTPFELTRVDGLPSTAMAPKSVLNDLRRRAVEQLLTSRTDANRSVIGDAEAISNFRFEISEWYPLTAGPVVTPQVHVLVRSLVQLQAALEWAPPEGVDRAGVYCEFEDIRLYKQAVTSARAAGVPIGLATVRIIKPGEEGLLKQVADCTPDMVLIRNLAGLSWFTTHAPAIPLVADYALNIANEITADLFARHGVVRMVPSYDLSWTEMSAMLKRISPGMFEAVVHQHMPMFHMEHCVFCHTLSNGTSYRDCGRPCDVHRVELKDRAGAAHPLVADVGCRNTVYNAAAQSAAEFIPRMRELGLQHFRIELLRESASEVGPLLDRYAQVLSGKDDGHETWRQLRVINQLGITRGTLSD